MTASRQPTGHDKAVRAVMDAIDGIEVWVGGRDDAGDDTYHSGTLDRDDLRTLAKAALRAARAHDRAALAAGDADVAAALGLREQARYREPVQPFPEPTPIEIRFHTDWREA